MDRQDKVIDKSMTHDGALRSDGVLNILLRKATRSFDILIMFMMQLN